MGCQGIGGELKCYVGLFCLFLPQSSHQETVIGALVVKDYGEGKSHKGII